MSVKYPQVGWRDGVTLQNDAPFFNLKTVTTTLNQQQVRFYELYVDQSVIQFYYHYFRIMLLNISINNTARSFVIGGWNELCSGIGKHNILSADECRRIAKVVNLPFMEMFQPYKHWPPACLQANAWNQISFNFGSMPKGNHIFWNPQQTGEQNPKAKPICRVHGKYTISYWTFHQVIH